MRVRPAAVAGRFYPAEPGALAALVDGLLAGAHPARPVARPVALVAPHAGFRYSGAVAATSYASVTPWGGEVSNVVILGPAHFAPLRGMAVPGVDAFATPLGPVAVDDEARSVARALPAVVVDDEPHVHEHAIETQLPFLLRCLGPGLRVLPVLVGATPPTDLRRSQQAEVAARGVSRHGSRRVVPKTDRASMAACAAAACSRGNVWPMTGAILPAAASASAVAV